MTTNEKSVESSDEDERITLKTYPDKESNESSIDSSNESVDAYLLPPSIDRWPSFYNSKQEDSIARNLLLVRRDPANDNRRNECIEWLRGTPTVHGLNKNYFLNNIIGI